MGRKASVQPVKPAIRLCSAEHRGNKCCLSAGINSHSTMRADRRSQLGLPSLIHQSADGYMWVVLTGEVYLVTRNQPTEFQKANDLDPGFTTRKTEE